MFGIKRLAFSGLTGILIAGLIIAGMSLAQWPETEDELTGEYIYPLSYTSPWSSLHSIPGPSLVWVDLTVSNFTEPVGVGSEAEIAVAVRSIYDIPNVTIRIDLTRAWPSVYPRGIAFLDGTRSRSWVVDLKGNVPVSFTERIRAFEIGFGLIKATARCWDETSLLHETLTEPVTEENFSILHPFKLVERRLQRTLTFSEGEDNASVLVSNDGILVTQEQIPEPPIYLLMHLSNFTEPAGVGSEADLTVFLIPWVDMQDISAEIVLPEGLSLVDGNLVWNGNLKANIREKFSARIRAEKVGNWTIVVAAGSCLPDGPWFGDSDVYGVWWHGDAQVVGLSVRADEITSWSGNYLLSPFPIGCHRVSFEKICPKSKVYLEPAVIDWSADGHNINDTLKLEVRVSDVTDLAAVQFLLKWDPTVLRFLSIEKGDLFEAQGSRTIFAFRQNDLGSFLAGCAPLPVVGVNVTGPDSGLVATVTFQVVNFTEGTDICLITGYGLTTLWVSSVVDVYSFEYMLPTHFVFKNPAD